MNYLSQLQAFRDYKMYETKLSSGQIALWYALMEINNKCAWIEWFTAANQTLETLSGLSRAGINKNRNVLKQLGLIDFKSNGKKATSYKVCVLYTSNSIQDSTQQSIQQGVQGSIQDSTQQSSTLIKHKQNKKETKQKQDQTTTADAYWLQFVENTESPFILENLKMWAEDFNGNDDIVIHGIETMLANNVRSYKYLETILKNWESKGFKVREDVITFEEQRKKQKEPKTITGRKETLPEWAKDDYKEAEETPMSEAEQAAFMERLNKLKGNGD